MYDVSKVRLLLTIIITKIMVSSVDRRCGTLMVAEFIQLMEKLEMSPLAVANYKIPVGEAL